MQNAEVTFHTMSYSPPVQNLNPGDKQAYQVFGQIETESWVWNAVCLIYVNTVEDHKVLTQIFVEKQALFRI